MASTSSTFSAHSPAGALMATDKQLEKQLYWQPCNAIQKRFLDEFYPYCRSNATDIPEITYAAKLAPNTTSEGSNPVISLSVSGRFDVLVKWVQAGCPEAIEWTRFRDNFKFPAVKMSSGGTRIFDSPEHKKPYAELYTNKSDYTIIVTEAHAAPLEEMDLLHFMTKLRKDTTRNWQYQGIRFPMVDLRHSPDISWFKGMKSSCGPVRMMPLDGTIVKVNEATQDNLLRMDEVGARIVSVTHMGMRVIGCRAEPLPPPPLVIDEPFYMGVYREEADIPLFVAYVVEDCWKKPSSLTEVDI